MRIPHLVEPILEKLGLTDQPGIDLAGLSLVYRRWCRRVPFDNLQKRLFYSGSAAGPVPGHNSEDFFQNWLNYGTGGTCWANSHALHDLVSELGFEAVRGAGTMLVTPDMVGPTHGTVVVTLEDRQYLVDGSMQTEEPLLLQEAESTGQVHPAARTRFERREGQWFLRWHPPHQIEGLWCRLEAFDVPTAEFDRYHERTRSRSPFNASLYIRLNQTERINTIAFGERVVVGVDGAARKAPLPEEHRVPALVEEFGIAEELAVKVPADELSARQR
ncbi:MAG: arylamine N-acetyltransferase [Dehalococcoidia bacterium]